jgi:4-amino-4-deoxy-L-arabinose transferase-like glycosyltransferase
VGEEADQAAVGLRSYGRAGLLGALAAGVVAVLGVEVLSLAHAVRQGPAVLLVVAALAVAGVVAWREAPRGPRVAPRPRVHPLDAAIVAIGLVTLAVALVAAPNTWDSMTYHLPRVAHWAANGSVAHYATWIDRQLWQPPFAEYLVLLGYVAVGGDRLANLPAWLAAAGTVVAASETARLLGRSAAARRLAAFVAATTPGLILEATSTQTDVVAALWIAIVAYLALAECLAPTWTWTAFAWLGAALGLAIGTKGMALPFGLPWIAVALAPAWRARRVDVALTGMGVVLAAVLAIGAGPWLRNLLVFNGPLGPSTVQALLRPTAVDPATVIGNLVANVTIHAGTPWSAANAALAAAVTSLHAMLGLDVAAAYPFFGGYRVDPWNTHENVAGNPVHLVVAAAGAGLAVATWRRRRPGERTYVLALALSVVLLGATVRWQPFNARLHLPLFVLLAPGIAITMRRFGRAASRVVALVLVVVALPPLLASATRPVLTSSLAMPGVRSVFATPRREQYFASRRDVLAVYDRLALAARTLGCRDFVLSTGYDGWEYPLGIVLGVPRLPHAFVRNASTEIGEAPVPPDACLIVVDQLPDWRPPEGPRRFALQWAEGRAAIWR